MTAGIDTHSTEYREWRTGWAAWHLEQMRARLQHRSMRPEFGEEPPAPPTGPVHLRLLRDDELDS